MQEFINELRLWQTGLGSLIGLFAIAFTVQANFYLTRKRDDQINKQKAEALGIEILAEFSAIDELLISRSKFLELLYKSDGSIEKDDLIGAEVPRARVYEKSVGGMGLIEREIVIAISTVHGLLLPTCVDSFNRIEPHILHRVNAVNKMKVIQEKLKEESKVNDNNKIDQLIKVSENAITKLEEDEIVKNQIKHTSESYVIVAAAIRETKKTMNAWLSIPPDHKIVGEKII